MALDIEPGTFTKDSTGTDGATNVVTTSFQPKAIIMWASKLATSDVITGGHCIFSYGFSDGSNHRSVAVRHEDAVARSDSLHTTRNDAIITLMDPGSSGILARGSIVFNANDFTVTWDLNDTVATRVHYIIYGGTDITGVQVGDFAKTTAAAPVTQSITVDADVQNIEEGKGILFVAGNNDNGFNTAINNGEMYIGMATKNSEVGSIWEGNDDNTARSEQAHSYADTEVILSRDPVEAGIIKFRGRFGEFTPTGFDINWINNINTAIPISFLIIKGGKWQVGHETIRTTNGTKATITDFKPKGLFSFGVKAISFGFGRKSLSWNVGASDGAIESSAAALDEHNADPTENGSASSITKCVRVFDNDFVDPPVVNSEAHVDSFNSNDFTLDWTDTNNDLEWKFVWCVCGDAGVAPPVVTPNNVFVLRMF